MPEEQTVKIQIKKLKSLGICNMTDVEKVRYYADALKYDALVKMLDTDKTNYRLFLMCT